MKFEIYYINRTDRSDRLDNMEKQRFLFKQISYNRKEAIIPNNKIIYNLYSQNRLTKEQYYRLYFHPPTSLISFGSIGCYLSHYELINNCANNNTIYIILEDDIVWKDDNIEKILLEIIPTDFDMIYFYLPWNNWIENAISFNDDLWKIDRGYMGTFGYILHPSHAKILLHYLNNITNHIDNMIINSHMIMNIKPTILLFKKNFLITDVSNNRDSNILPLKKKLFKKNISIIPKIFHFFYHDDLKNQIFSWTSKHHLDSFDIIIHHNLQDAKKSLYINGGWLIHPFIYCNITFCSILNPMIDNIIIIDKNNNIIYDILEISIKNNYQKLNYLFSILNSNLILHNNISILNNNMTILENNITLLENNITFLKNNILILDCNDDNDNDSILDISNDSNTLLNNNFNTLLDINNDDKILDINNNDDKILDINNDDKILDINNDDKILDNDDEKTLIINENFLNYLINIIKN